ncbi:Por secretion system C-terminal sorting domain-containing protein [Hyunsoonleella jejuensis]|uniref:Por secretion system C-terminal sorting domain-containing protein n=1 Tax=Hyunsoonleella jejuensis TaxID=419940 RepID=A0A1H9CV03_9FLAO|nr:T9SS type A sorting domain-containing protein [Hyunsoonleella jejuensis]SEQ05004.1 Por secretion system C-terminal sorting domain-containing protein [Hyunsoonleella jejuensis]
MMKKLLFCTTLLLSVYASNAQGFSNLVFDTTIPPTATTVDVTFDYSGISTGDVFEWQLFLANPDGSPNWGSGRNIAYEGNIVPTSMGSGTQTVTINIFNTPVDGEVFTWAGKITLGSDGSDTGFNNTGNLVTISSTASVEEVVNKNSILIFPNPVENILNIDLMGVPSEKASILDMTGKVVMKLLNITTEIDVSNLEQGFYFLKTNDNRSFKFVKK